MKKLLILLFISFFLLLISCSSFNVSDDSDTPADADAGFYDTEPDDDYDEDYDYDDDYEEDSDEMTEEDTSEKVECLNLRDEKNVAKTPFPFYSEGRPTFCRPGCDTPSENDPQCVRNIWEWRNWEQYNKYLSHPEYKNECYPWPCELTDAGAKTKETLDTLVSSCDRILSIYDYYAVPEEVWSHGIYDGTAGMMMYDYYIVEYDIEKDRFTILGGNPIHLAFNENRYIAEIYDISPADKNSFIISILKTDEGYFYELITRRGRQLEYPPLSSKNWALLPYTNTDLRYASTADWKWHSLGFRNYKGKGGIVGDHLAVLENGKVYYCDLKNYPSTLNDCLKINRKTEYGSVTSVQIDAENEHRIVYVLQKISDESSHGWLPFRKVQSFFVEVDLSDPDNPKYKEYEFSPKSSSPGVENIQMLRGNKLLYFKNSKGCFYRFDTGEKYCPEERVFSVGADDAMGYNVFWKKWHLWKTINSYKVRSAAIIRDWECYCEETGICPFKE